MGRSPREVEVLDPDRDDPRLQAVGAEAVAWADGDVLTIAVRRSGVAPFLIGTVTERMWRAGRGRWALRLRIPDLERACIEYAVIGLSAPTVGEPSVWRGPRSRRPKRPVMTPTEPMAARTI